MGGGDVKVPILRVYDPKKQKYVGIPAIRGEPGEDGAPDAVRFTEQALTDAEKAQARGNIDAPKTAHSHTKSDITDFPSTMAPTAHKDSHKTGGADALSPGDIGAAQATHSHTKSQITDFPTSFVDPTDPATEGYTKLGTLTTSSQSFTVPAIPSEILIVAKNISGNRAPSVVFDDDSDGKLVTLGYTGKPQYSGAESYSGLSFRKILHLAGFYTYNGSSQGGLYSHVDVGSANQSWTAALETFRLELTFNAAIYSYNAPRSGTVELWYR